MELAGLNIVMDADFSAVFSSFAQANTMAHNFVANIKNVFNGIPDLGKKLSFTSNGASQAIQDQRELARTARELASAELDKVRAQDILDKAQQRTNNSTRAAKDEYAQLVAQNQALVREYYNASASIIRYGDAAGISAEKLEQLRVAAKDGQDQLQKIEQGVGRFQRNVGNYASGNAALAQQLRQITTELPNFFISARIGMQSLSNNLPGIFNELTRIREANVALAASGQPTVSVFKQFLASFNPLNVAIGVGVGLLTAYGPELIEMAKGLFAGSEAAQRAAKAQEEYDKATADATKTATAAAVKEQANADVLYAATQNVALSYDQRKYAAKELISIAPFIFKGLSDEAIVAGEAEEAYKKLTAAIKDKIAVAVNEKQAETLLTQLVETKEIVDKNSELAGIGDKINAIQQKKLELDKKHVPFDSQQQRSLSNQLNLLYKQADALGAIKTFRGLVLPNKTEQLQAIQDYVNAFTKYGEKVNEISALRGKVDELFQPVDKPKKQREDHTAEQLEKAKEDITIAWYKINQEDQKGLDEFLKRHDEIGSNDLKATYLTDNLLEIQAYFNDSAKSIQEGADKEALALQIELDAWENQNKELQKIHKQKLDLLKNFQQATASILVDTLSQAAELVGEGIGSLFTGKSFDIFGNLGRLLGDQIIAFGKQLIIASGIMQAAQEAIASLAIAPAVALAAGIAAIAGGAALKAALSKDAQKVGKFASGGVAYGPTLGLFGEYSNARSNPEVVAPLDKLQTILKNSGGGSKEPIVIIPDVRLSGPDLVLSFERAKKGIGR